MSIDSLKKQAKNLHRLVPVFLEQHVNVRPSLAACQDLVARIHGYPSWHSAAGRTEVARQSADESEPPPSNSAPDNRSTTGLYTALGDFENNQRRQMPTPGKHFLRELGQHSGEHTIINFPITDVTMSEEVAAKRLHEDIEYQYRLDRDSSATIILTVKSADVPDYVIKAINLFYCFGIKIVVVHGPDCSLDTPNNLSSRLMTAIAKVGGKGSAWHPNREEYVQFSPRSSHLG